MLFIFYIYVRVCVYVCGHKCRAQRTTCGGQFLGFELRTLGFMVGLLAGPSCWPLEFYWQLGKLFYIGGGSKILWLALVLGAKYLLYKFALAYLVEGLGLFVSFVL